MSLYPILIIVSRDSKVIDDYKNLDIAYVDCTQCSNNFETALHVKKYFKIIKKSNLYTVMATQLIIFYIC